MDYTVVLASIIVFLVVTFLLVGMLLGAKAKIIALWTSKFDY